MPFQSEKQRRYLHANHPEIAKRWERDYAHGGILDINESEEIISDDGNEIALTDYNAAFDDPNDLSTGVKSLFRAKEGGRIGFFTGMREAEQKQQSSQDKSPGHPANQPSVSTKSSTQAPDQGGHSRFEVGSGYYNEPITKKTQGTGGTGEWSGDYEEEFFIGPRWEAYNNKEWVNVNRNHYEETKRVQLAKLKKRGLWKLAPLALMIFGGVPPIDAVKAFPKTIAITSNDISAVITESIPVMKAKKDLIASLEKYKGDLLKDVDIHNPNEMANLDDTDFPDVMTELTELTKTRDDEDDDTKGDGPELPPQLGGPSTEEMAREYRRSDLERIRAGQAKRAMLVEKDIIQDNPIVSGTERDIIAIGNSGGLANLFRVKKQ